MRRSCADWQKMMDVPYDVMLATPFEQIKRELKYDEFLQRVIQQKQQSDMAKNDKV